MPHTVLKCGNYQLMVLDMAWKTFNWTLNRRKEEVLMESPASWLLWGK
jgi:hypothetical protein